MHNIIMIFLILKMTFLFLATTSLIFLNSKAIKSTYDNFILEVIVLSLRMNLSLATTFYEHKSPKQPYILN